MTSHLDQMALWAHQMTMGSQSVEVVHVDGGEVIVAFTQTLDNGAVTGRRLSDQASFPSTTWGKPQPVRVAHGKGSSQSLQPAPKTPTIYRLKTFTVGRPDTGIVYLVVIPPAVATAQVTQGMSEEKFRQKQHAALCEMGLSGASATAIITVATPRFALDAVNLGEQALKAYGGDHYKASKRLKRTRGFSDPVKKKHAFMSIFGSAYKAYGDEELTQLLNGAVRYLELRKNGR